MKAKLSEELINDKLNSIIMKLDDITNKLNDIFNNTDNVHSIETFKANLNNEINVVTSVTSSEADSYEFSLVDNLPKNNEPTIEDIWKTLPTYKSKDVIVDGSPLLIKKFNLDCIVSSAHICIIGKRGTGKSWLCRNIMNLVDKKDQKLKIIIAPTDKMNPFYKNYFQKSLIYHQYNDKILNALIGKQEKSIEYCNINKLHNPKVFLVMDDCLASKGKWRKSKIMLELLMNGRHYKIAYMLTMQFPLSISPELRNNFDYIFLFADDSIIAQKRIYEHYSGMFPSFNTFKQVFDELTKDHGCMVICNRGKRKTFHDKVFWFKVEN